MGSEIKRMSRDNGKMNCEAESFGCKIRIELAGLSVPLSLRCPESAAYFRNYLITSEAECSDGGRGTSAYTGADVKTASVTGERLKMVTDSGIGGEAYAEYVYILEDITRCILPYRRSLFHSVAIRYNGGAFLLAGPSGIGKSTQYKNLLRLYGEKIEIINGDKPVLYFPEEGPVMVYPSPWMGKEDWGDAGLSAPLRGIVCLEQNEENNIERLSVGESVLPVYRQFLYLPESREAVNQICDYEEILLGNTPVWRMSNKGDPASSRMLFEKILNQ